MLESWIMDFRYAGRRLLRRPTYAVLAVLTLALGGGGTAAIFSVVRTLLLDPLPIAREEPGGRACGSTDRGTKPSSATCVRAVSRLRLDGAPTARMT